jgi:hypothetical protein
MRSLLCLATWASLLPFSAAASAQDFRVDTEVFAGKEKEPIAETLTIFSSGRVYDFLLGGSREITIFEPAAGQFTFLDPERKLRCTIASQEVLDYVLELNKAAVQQKVPLFAAAADPQFEVQEEEELDEEQEKKTGRTRVTLTSKSIIYTAVGKAPQQHATVDAFKQFADWYARLNAIRGGGNLPPGARLALNRELALRKLLPDEITRVTIQSGLREKRLEVRSRHLFNWALSVADRQRIEQAGDYLANFQAVSFSEFRSLPGKPPAEKTTKR